MSTTWPSLYSLNCLFGLCFVGLVAQDSLCDCYRVDRIVPAAQAAVVAPVVVGAVGGGVAKEVAYLLSGVCKRFQGGLER